jgi:hypothetical protein
MLIVRKDKVINLDLVTDFTISGPCSIKFYCNCMSGEEQLDNFIKFEDSQLRDEAFLRILNEYDDNSSVCWLN